MAVTENYKSREMHITKEGTTIMQYFDCNADDLPFAGQNGLPLVGTPWSSYRQDMRCSDIRVWWKDGRNCTVEALYSTEGLSHRERRADKVSSVKNTFDFSLTQEEITSYSNYVTGGAPKKWSEEWVAADGDEDNLPSLYKYTPNIVFIEKFYVDGWAWNDLKDGIGKVNNADFLRQMADKYPSNKRDLEYRIVPGTDDTGNWLCAGIHAETIGDDNVEITITYLYKERLGGANNGWNYEDNGNLSVNTNMYQTYNFQNLPYPTNTDDTIDDDFRGD